MTSWRSARELARTYGIRGIARRIVHEAMIKSGTYRLHRPADKPLAFRARSIATADARAWFAANPDSARVCIAEADALLLGRMRFFGATELEVGWPPQWLLHPRTGAVWSADAYWTESRDSSHERGDIKWIWEPARFGFAWLLARACVASGDVRYADELWRGIASWDEANPAYRGPGWSCGQETALRAIALVFATAVVPPRTDRERSLLDRLLHASARRIAMTLGHSLSQRNNHAISEAVGLATLAALAADGTHEVARWRTASARALREAIADQFGTDGSYIQESLNYHRLAIHLLMWVRAFVPMPALDEALFRSVDLLTGMLPAEGGALPNYGHNDGALLLQLSSCDYRDHRPALQALSGGFAAGPWDELGVWLGAPHAFANRARPALRATSGGYVTLRSGTRFAFVRVPCFGGHRPGQADALHVDVWRGARNIAVDPGTFSYSDPRPWDNRLVETRVHNTVSIGDASQMRRRGRFLWTDWTCATLLDQHASATRSVVLARVRAAWSSDHQHTRMIVVDAGGVSVLDAVEGSADATLRLHWNLDGMGWIRNDSTWTDGTDRMAIRAPVGARVSEVRGAADAELGWMSNTYGARVPCTAIEVEVVARRAAFVTDFGASVDASLVETWNSGDFTRAFRIVTER